MKNEALYTSKIVHGPFGHVTKWNSTVSFSQQHAHLEVLWHDDDDKWLPAPLHHNYGHHLDMSTPTSISSTSMTMDKDNGVADEDGEEDELVSLFI